MRAALPIHQSLWLELRCPVKPDTSKPERPSHPAARIVSRWVNGLAVARNYRLAWLPHDAMEGLSLSAVLVHAGMAYALGYMRAALRMIGAE